MYLNLKIQFFISSQSERQQVKASDTDIGNRPETFSENQTTSQTSANDRRCMFNDCDMMTFDK